MAINSPKPVNFQGLIAEMNVLLGITRERYPSTAEFEYIVDYIKKRMNRFSSMDFSNAMVLYIQGQLDMAPKHHDKLSPLLLEQIMQSYARYRFVIIDDYKKKESEEVVMTDSEKDAIVQEGCLRAFNVYRSKKSIVDFGNATYDYLDRIGLINLDVSVKREIYAEAEKQYIQDAEESYGSPIAMNRAIRSGRFNLSDGGTVQNIISLAKNIALGRYFDGLIMMDMELADELNDIANVNSKD